MRCPTVCPSKALQEVPVDQVKMGEARLDRTLCFVWMEDIICHSCFERCPLKGKAIVLQGGIYPVITEKCTGCGICEHVCPKQAIVTVPASLLL
jgi:Pyruvate/2-oxoacid:ferredoxin oxidoreductase delta subunit